MHALHCRKVTLTGNSGRLPASTWSLMSLMSNPTNGISRANICVSGDMVQDSRFQNPRRQVKLKGTNGKTDHSKPEWPRRTKTSALAPARTHTLSRKELTDLPGDDSEGVHVHSVVEGSALEQLRSHVGRRSCSHHLAHDYLWGWVGCVCGFGTYVSR